MNLSYKMLFFLKCAWAKCIFNHLTTISWIYKINIKTKKMLSNKVFKKNYKIIGVHYNIEAKL
jgi:hypothetical protein